MVSFIQRRRVHYPYIQRYLYIYICSMPVQVILYAYIESDEEKIVRSIVFSTRDYALLVKIIISFAV